MSSLGYIGLTIGLMFTHYLFEGVKNFKERPFYVHIVEFVFLLGLVVVSDKLIALF
ncbi:hypothetical protein P4361_00310 [Fictibacillus sp. B-59209]|uniref:hypothetical protein n=1 Tax=Fictibacillus sp. B-59209 TaxID=3024873 RepID=UPI002E1E173E|nr:hypothetical protein [Fictibacillus sp. B-59209]